MSSECYIFAMWRILRRQPAMVVSVLFCLVIWGMYSIIVWMTGGMFVYPLDDSYIHLAMARTLLLHHVWGIGVTGFASASSSPGWTVLLATTDALIGRHLVNGIVLNIISAVAMFFVVDYALKIFRPAAMLWFRYFTLLVILFCTPLTSLTMIGMEHVAQTLSVLLFVALGAQVLALEPRLSVSRRMMISLSLIAVFAGAIRYETAFVVIPLCICLVLRRRVGLAVTVAFCSAMAPIAFGFYFYKKSGFWLPFSVMSKALGQPPATIKYFVDQTHGFRSLVPAILLVWLLRFRKLHFWDSSQLLLFFAFCITLLHLALAPTGWLMRYESYLSALCLFSLCVAAAEVRAPQTLIEDVDRSSMMRRSAMVLLALFVLGIGFDMSRRAIHGIVEPLQASEDRFLEHIQMARFVSGAYDHNTVVVNDIGTIAFYSHAHLLDVIGLGSVEPIHAIHDRHSYTAVDVGSWASSQHASIAILQTQWRRVSDVIPPTWTKVQTWTIPRNVVFRDYDISFFAVTPKEIPRLCANLQKFTLPAQDKVTSFAPCLTSTSYKVK